MDLNIDKDIVLCALCIYAFVTIAKIVFEYTKNKNKQ